MASNEIFCAFQFKKNLYIKILVRI